jgi:hypothetical protein
VNGFADRAASSWNEAFDTWPGTALIKEDTGDPMTLRE